MSDSAVGVVFCADVRDDQPGVLVQSRLAFSRNRIRRVGRPRFRLQQVADEPDALVSLVEKVVGGLPGAGVVVDDHEIAVKAVGSAVDDDEGRPARCSLSRCSWGWEAVDAFGDQVGDDAAFAVGFLIEACGENGQSSVAEDVLERAEQAREVAVGNVFEQGADDSGAGVLAA